MLYAIAIFRQVHYGMNKQRLLEKILSGSKNVRFNDFVRLVEAFGFELSRIRGSHYIFEHPNVREILNLQNDKGQAKPYQIRQFLQLVEQYDLELED
jgi:predicted RNA binding protein YcfA (HicA-like mRNA interferase family)